MPEQDYTNREINHMFHEIKETLGRIETQVIKTNGRVSALEIWKESIMAKVAGVTSAVAIGWVLLKEFIIK